jgi:hypothetical protein
MILLIRGHIRKSFDTIHLHNLVKKIYDITPDLKIFIHTWTIISNNISWRKIETNDRIVTEELIYSYFDEFKHLIKKIIIDDDNKIELIGNLKGNINGGPMPIIGWKNYWYGKYKIIDDIYNENIYTNEMIVNVRFDVLNNSNSLSEEKLVDFIKNNIGIEFKKNNFIYDKETNGIDNIYIGNLHTMHKLITYFYTDLDDILNKNKNIRNQERLVYIINKNLFDLV